MVPSNNHSNNGCLPEKWPYQPLQSLQWLHNNECLLTSVVVWKFHSRKLYANRSFFPTCKTDCTKIFLLRHCTLVSISNFEKPLLHYWWSVLNTWHVLHLLLLSVNPGILATEQALSLQSPAYPKPVTICSQLLVTSLSSQRLCLFVYHAKYYMINAKIWIYFKCQSKPTDLPAKVKSSILLIRALPAIIFNIVLHVRVSPSFCSLFNVISCSLFRSGQFQFLWIV